MANVNWMKGNIEPSESGDYYVILETKKFFKFYKKGDIKIGTDWYNKGSKEFEMYGEDNDYWKIISWAKVPKPEIPREYLNRVVKYMGKRTQQRGNLVEEIRTPKLKVNWINCNVEPSESGEYYTLFESKKNYMYFKQGDIIIDIDFYDTDSKKFYMLSDEPEYWKIISWAKAPKPDVPIEYQDRVVKYMGERIKRKETRNSSCKECVCEQVCKYNDGVNKYCKGNCPHFALKHYFAESTYKFEDTVFVVNHFSEIEEHTIAYFSIYEHGVIIGFEDGCEYTGDRVFASKSQAEDFLKGLDETKK